jgi:hypothetical protein
VGAISSYCDVVIPWEPPPPVNQARSGTGWIIAGVLTVLLVLLMGFVGILVVVSNTFSHFAVRPSRKYLKPTPIAVSACPYVSLMHAAANNLQSAEPVVGFAFDEHGNALTWPQTRARLDPALRLMEYSIAVSESKFPVPVRQQLTVVLDMVRQGRVQLALARDGTDFNLRTAAKLADGQLAFGYAGDLIGTQCAVPLRADTSTMLYPFMTTTSSPRRPSTTAT